MNPLILVCCHDAGGAEVVSSWVRRHLDEWDIEYLLAGPAVKIFERKLGVRPPFIVSGNPDFFLCGTGSSGWERNAVDVAHALEVPSAAYLDHWKNYRERFGEHLPTAIWVCDQYAEEMAREEFPEAVVLLRGNPYLEDFAEEVEVIEPPDEDGTHRILWIDEPDYRDRFRPYVRALRRAEILVRLHPAATSGDRKAALAVYAGVCDPRVAGDGETLAENVAWADVVVGADSMALVAALAAGKSVVSVLHKKDATIPYPEIKRPFA